MATKEIFSLSSSDGHTKLSGILWKPEKEVQMILQISHGMIEHIRFYEEFALCLTRQGIMVVGHDHLGHGRSAQTREDFGFFAEKDGYIFLIQDLHRVRRWVQARFPDVPYFMMGHSMGSFMLRRYLTVFGDGLSGAVIMGTGHPPKILAAAGLLISHAASLCLGASYRSRLIQDGFRAAMNHRFLPLHTSMDWLSSDNEQVDRFLSDPYTDFLFTLSAYRDLLRMIWESENRKLIGRIPKNLPLLLISGKEDPVGEFGKGVKKAFAEFKRAGCTDVKAVLYDEMRHELVIEKNRIKTARDISCWMKTRKE